MVLVGAVFALAQVYAKLSSNTCVARYRRAVALNHLQVSAIYFAFVLLCVFPLFRLLYVFLYKLATITRRHRVYQISVAHSWIANIHALVPQVERYKELRCC